MRGFGMVVAMGTLLFATTVRAETVRGRVEASFSATSTLHDFGGHAAPVDVVLVPEADGRFGVEVRVPVASLDTGNGWRDDGMRALLRVDTHPDIVARLTGIAPDAVQRDGTLPLELTIAGVTRPVTARIRRWEQHDDRLALDVALELSLTAFGLEPPRTLFVRVGDTVRVQVGVQLRRE